MGSKDSEAAETMQQISVIITSLLLLVGSVVSSESWTKTFFKAFQDLTLENPDYAAFEIAKTSFAQHHNFNPNAKAVDLPYFKVFPKYLGNFPPGHQEEFINTTCYKNIKISSQSLESGVLELRLEHREEDNLFCHRSFVISTGKQFKIKEVWGNGETVFQFESDGNPETEWDLFTRGPRVFMYPMTPEDLTYNLAATAALFEPVATLGVGSAFANMNREFLSAYAGINMEERNGPDVLDIDESMVGNGDTFDIMRLDGLDPMIAWAMGSATGHTAIALWRNESLFICESNAVSPYWPVNGIQCNPFKDWLEYGRVNGYNVVWAPLKQEIRASLDLEAAWALVDYFYGVDYGFEIVLTGLLDTLKDNLPCVDAIEGALCLEPEHLEMLFSYVERISKEAARVYKPAVLQRAGVPFDTTMIKAYYEADKKGISSTELYSLPEQDNWKYETTRFGEPELSEVSICNVFVCRVWKAAGLFSGINDEINCSETSVNDNYRLAIYSDPELRPEVCRQTDPDNPNCQLLGRYSLRLDSQPGELPRYNYVTMSPHMFESCPSLAPSYLASPTC